MLQRSERERTFALEKAQELMHGRQADGGVDGVLFEADLEEGLMKLQEARKALESREEESAVGIVEAKTLLEAKTAFWRTKNTSKDEVVKRVERDITAAEEYQTCRDFVRRERLHTLRSCEGC